MNQIIDRRTLWIAAFVGTLVWSGCSSKPTSAYIPPSSAAKAALERSLSAWKSGTPHGTLHDKAPAIDVFDSRWQAGRKLESYSIGSEIAGEPHPTFNVTLRVEGDEREEETSFHVVGIDPLHVFRDADFKKATGQ